jgi:hypothetical protein
MAEKLTQFSINKGRLVNHVKKVCIPNKKRGAKICKKCPFAETINREIVKLEKGK